MLKDRFRKYLPVVVDLETGGFDSNSNAILEIAITLIEEENEEIREITAAAPPKRKLSSKDDLVD